MSQKYNRKAFTLLELMIAVAIIAGIAAIAIPAFQRYMYDAKEAQMVSALGEVYRDMQRVKMDMISQGNTAVPATQYLYSDNQPYLYYRPSGSPKFNVITGRLVDDLAGPNAKYALSQFDEWQYLQPTPGQYSLNTKFGYKLDVNNNLSILYGAEYNMDGDDNFHVLAVDHNGSFYKLCDDYSNSKPGAQIYQAWSDGTRIVCEAAGGGGNSSGSSDGESGICSGMDC